MKNRYMLHWLLLLVLFSCADSNLPDGVLPKKKMVPILVDIHLAEAINNQKFNLALDRDSLPEDLYLSICKKHNIDRTVIEKSLLYYGKHTRRYMPIYDEVLNILNEMDIKSKGDSIRPAPPGAFDADTAKIRKEAAAKRRALTPEN